MRMKMGLTKCCDGMERMMWKSMSKGQTQVDGSGAEASTLIWEKLNLKK